MDVSSIASSSLQAASQAVQVRANNIVNQNTPAFQPQAPVFNSVPNGGVVLSLQTGDQPVNLVRETVGLIGASAQYEAAARLIETDAELTEQLLDTFG